MKLAASIPMEISERGRYFYKILKRGSHAWQGTFKIQTRVMVPLRALIVVIQIFN
jgi:hypothetical protein